MVAPEIEMMDMTGVVAPGVDPLSAAPKNNGPTNWLMDQYAPGLLWMADRMSKQSQAIIMSPEGREKMNDGALIIGNQLGDTSGKIGYGYRAESQAILEQGKGITKDTERVAGMLDREGRFLEKFPGVMSNTARILDVFYRDRKVQAAPVEERAEVASRETGGFAVSEILEHACMNRVGLGAIEAMAGLETGGVDSLFVKAGLGVACGLTGNEVGKQFGDVGYSSIKESENNGLIAKVERVVFDYSFSLCYLDLIAAEMTRAGDVYNTILYAYFGWEYGKRMRDSNGLYKINYNIKTASKAEIITSFVNIIAFWMFVILAIILYFFKV